MTSIQKGYVDLDTGQIHWRAGGSGDCLLFIHQAASDSSAFEPVMEQLASQFRVLALDLPGFGMSDFPPKPYSVPEYANVVRNALAALSVTKTSIFGQHGGGAVAAYLAASHPALVEKLVLSGAPLYRLDQAKELLAAFPRIVIKEDGSHLVGFWRYMATWTPPTDEREAEALTYELVGRLRPGPRNIEAYAAVFSFDLAACLKRIRAPALVMAGELAPVRKDVTALCALLQKSCPVIVPNGTNWLEAQPELLASILHDFLTSHT